MVTRLGRHALDFEIVGRARDLDGILEHVAGAVGEPEFEPALEQQRREDRDHHGRHRGDDREQSDQPGVQAAAAEPALLRPAPCATRRE